MNDRGKKKSVKGNGKDGRSGVGGACSAPCFIFNCSLQFFMVMSPLPLFQNNRPSVCAILAAFHFRGLFLKRLLLQPNGFCASLNTARHQAGLRFQGLAPNERPNHTEGKHGSALLHQTQPVVYLLKHNRTPSLSLFPPFFSSSTPSLPPPPVMTLLLYNWT